MLSGRLAELANYLYELGCVEVGEFTLKEHENKDLPPSPVRFNFRTADHPTENGPLTSVGLVEVGQFMGRLISERNLKIDKLVGLPSSGEPLAESVALALDLPDDRLIRLNKVSLRDGNRRIVGPIEGDLYHGESCVMIDDVISLSRSKMEGRGVLARRGAKLEHLLVVVDRQQGGHRLMKQIGVEVHSLFPARVLLAHGVAKGYLEEEVAVMYDLYLDQVR